MNLYDQVSKFTGVHRSDVKKVITAIGWVDNGSLEPAARSSEGITDNAAGDSQHMDKTIRELQSSLPWTGHYHRDFRASPMTHKDFAHALLHVHKAGGKLASLINDAEHGGIAWEHLTTREVVEKYIADFVICALRMANTMPEGVIDLQGAVERRIATKNNQLAMEATAHATNERSKP